MRDLKQLGAALLAVVTLVTSAPAKEAQSVQVDAAALSNRLASAGREAEHVWKNMTVEEQAAVLRYLQPDHAETTRTRPAPSGVSTQAGGCSEYTLGYTMYNSGGATLWRYNQVVQWCFNGTYVTSTNHYEAPQVAAPLWAWVGNIGSNQTGGVNKTDFYSFTQGHFQLCLAPGNIGCVYHNYPWVWQRVFGNGGTSGNAGI
jgi:hypothetical protein